MFDHTVIGWIAITLTVLTFLGSFLKKSTAEILLLNIIIYTIVILALLGF